MQGKLLLSAAADAGNMGEVNRLLSEGVDVNAYGLVRGAWGGAVGVLRGFLHGTLRGVEVNAMLDVLPPGMSPLLYHAATHAMTK